MKKIAAPGRRGSTKRTAFIGDGEIVDEIDPNSIEGKKKQEELEAKKLLEEKEAEEAAIAAELLRQQQEKEAELAAGAALVEKKRLKQEKLRQQELERKQQEEAEEAAAAAELLRQQQEAEELAERKRLRREEKLRLQKEAEEAEQLRLQQEADEAAAAAELQRQQQEEAEAIAERKRKIREEKLKLQREAEEAEQIRLQQEAEEAAAAAELLRQQQEAEELAERKRLRREEKLRLQKEAEEAERIRIEQEEFAELLRKQEEDEELERKRLRKEEKLRKRKEEEERLRRQQEEDEAELIRQQEEEEKEKQRQLEIEENERIKIELARQEQIRKIEEENARIEQERINREKQNAAKAKSKRDAFLDDMDSFSETFSQKQAIKEDKLQKTLASEEVLLASTISSASNGFTAPQSTRSQNQESVTKSSTNQPVSVVQDNGEVSVPEFYDKSQVVTQSKQQPASSSSSSTTTTNNNNNPNSEQFNLLTSALFSGSGSNDIDNDPYATTTTTTTTTNEQQRQQEDEVLRLPNRSVTVNKTKKDKGNVTFNTSISPSPQSEVKFATAVSSRNEAKTTNYEEPEEEEDEETFLPRMTEAEKAVWRAKQEDLTRRRKDFHGACTYAFKGVFAWQMYSAVDAVDEFGKAYTEYLMRCQWGTTWENMQPWLVARRFREFDALNDLLQKNFPQLKQKMFPLPKKLIFGSLTSETIDQRTKDIEEYIATIITDIPPMLRSRYIDEFFGISERIKTISKQIEELNKKLPQVAPEEEPLYTGMVSFAPGVEEEMGGGNNGDSKVEVQHEEEEKGIIKSLQLEDLFTLDDVENLCNDNTRPFDSDELGQIEEYVRDLRSILRKTKAKNIPSDPHVRKYINLCQNNWVRLHRTCLIDPSGSTGGVMLIPRAMQAEEELDGAIKELRSLLIAQSMGSPLHF